MFKVTVIGLIKNLVHRQKNRQRFDLASSLIDIINEYIKTKSAAFDAFIESYVKLKGLKTSTPKESEAFILDLLSPNRDARIFEIVSFAILKYFYHDQTVYFGFDLKKLSKERLKLFKTGLSANDGEVL